MSVVAQDSVVNLLFTLQPYHNDRSAVSDAILSALRGDGIGVFSYAAFVGRIETYRETSMYMAFEATTHGPDCEPLETRWANLARWRIGQAIDYSAILERLFAEFGKP